MVITKGFAEREAARGRTVTPTPGTTSKGTPKFVQEERLKAGLSRFPSGSPQEERKQLEIIKDTQKRVSDVLKRQGKRVTIDGTKITAIDAQGRREIITLSNGKFNIKRSGGGVQRERPTRETGKPTFEEMAEIPFGPAQRITISELQRQQQAAKDKLRQNIEFAVRKQDVEKLRPIPGTSKVPDIEKPTPSFGKPKVTEEDIVKIEPPLGVTEQKLRLDIDVEKLKKKPEEFKVTEEDIEILIAPPQVTKTKEVIEKERKEAAKKRARITEVETEIAELKGEDLTAEQIFERGPVPTKKSFLEVSEKRRKIREKELKLKNIRGEITFVPGLESTLLGITASTVGAVEFGKRILTQLPEKTFEETLEGARRISGELFSGKLLPKLGAIIQEDPGFAIGFVAGEVAQASFAGKAFGKVKTKLRGGKVKVLKAKARKVDFGEVTKLSDEGIGETIKRIVIEAEEKQKLIKTKVKPFTRAVTPPQDATDLLTFVERKDIRFIFGLDVDEVAKTSFPTFFQEVPKKVRKFQTKPTPFEIKGPGKKAIKADLDIGDISLIGKTQIDELIDPTKFKLKKVKKDDRLFAVLEKKVGASAEVPKEFKSLRIEKLGQDLPITKVFKTKRELRNIFTEKRGEFLQKSIFKEDLVRIRGRLPILEISPILTPTKLIFIGAGRFILGKDIDKEFAEISIKGRALIPGQEAISRIESKAAQRRKPISELDLSITAAPIPDIATDIILDTEKAVRAKPIVDVALFEEQKIVPEQKQKPIIEEQEIVKPGVPAPLLFKLPGLEPKKEKLKGFDAFVTQKGKLVKVNTVPLTRNDAFSASARVVDNTPAATGTIKPSKSKKEPIPKNDFFFQNNFFKFRDFSFKTGKKFKNKFFERNQFRIDSPGELAGITVKGQLARQRKAQQKKFKSILL